jgi:hypothetical protein
MAVKGKTVGLEIFTVLDDVKSDYHKSKDLHDQMHQAYRSQNFDEAIWHCQRLSKHFGGKMSGYYNMWIERCEYMKTQKLPKDWSGVFIATTK